MQSQHINMLKLLVIFWTPAVLSYPANQYYGNKRYVRSQAAPYDPYDNYYRPGYGYPMNYYALYPYYSQNVPDDYYSQEGYPAIFYPRSSKYEIYQAVLPYYQDLPLTRNKGYYSDYYGYQDQDPEEKLLQDIEREQREQAQPIGHEIRYETDYNNADDQQSIDEINRAFVRNLMAMDDSNPKNFYQYDYPDSDSSQSTTLPKWDDMPYDRPVSSPNQEDEDVKELKELTQNKVQNNKGKGKKQRKQRQRKQKNNVKIQDPNNDDIHWFKEPSYMEQSQNDQVQQKRGLFDNTVTYTDRKPIVITTEKPFVLTTNEPQKNQKVGQKEEVMMRPATPVRHPLSDSVLEMMASKEAERERKRVPSVYDTIKKMLEMEKMEEEQSGNIMEDASVRPSMKKRIISNEDSLTKQLTVLKKMH